MTNHRRPNKIIIKEMLLKQHNTGPYIGAYLALYTRAGIFINFISVLMLAGTFWSTGAREYIQFLLPWFTFWMFLVLLAVILHIGMLVIWKVVEPSIISYTNRQGWAHNNPSRQEFQKLHDRLDVMETNNNAILECLKKQVNQDKKVD